VLSFAALWGRWKNRETGEHVASCTIIVTDANTLTRPIHDRIPVLLDRADFGPWLTGAASAEIPQAGRGGSRSHVASVQASQQDGQRRRRSYAD
jgi:putative SOS response-associated peptidase YedK